MDSSLPKPILPTLAKLHRPLAPFAHTLLRIGTGAIFIPHGIQELFFRGTAPAGKYLLMWGLKEPLAASWAPALLECVGGALLVLGLATRPVALLFTIEMAFATLTHLKYGWTWTSGQYPAFLLALCLAIFFRGGGRYSLDRRIGREF